MTIRLKIDPQALVDLREANQYYREKSEPTAERFLDAIDDQLDKILDDPERFPPLRQKPIWQRALMKKFPFIVVFEHFKISKIVHIIAVWHKKRDFSKLKHRF